MATSISVFCIWRNSEKHIHKTLKQLENLESLDGFEFSFYFYENDSTDNTAEILSNWIEKRKGSFLSEKLNAQSFGRTTSPERMKFLCKCRNKCKDLAGLNLSDYSLLIDSDIEFNNDNFLMHFEFMQKNYDVAMSTANVRQKIPDFVFNGSIDSYYDVYPFRDKHGNQGIYFADCPSYKPEDQLDWKLGTPIKCMSAFGGFALVCSNYFNKVRWSADTQCDHVNMCFELSSFGDIYCLPRNKVYVDVSLDDVDMNSVLNTAALQKQHYEKYFL